MMVIMMIHKDFEEIAYIDMVTFGFEGLFIGFQRVVYHSGVYLKDVSAQLFCQSHNIKNINDLIGCSAKIRKIYGDEFVNKINQIIEIYVLIDYIIL